MTKVNAVSKINKKHPYVGIHQFVCIDYIGLDECPTEYSETFTTEGTMDTVLFIKVLTNYELEHNKNTNVRLFWTIKIMLPRDLKDVEPFAKHIMNTVAPCHPWFYTLHSVKKCTYLTIYVTEREYYPEGIYIDKLAPSDYWRDTRTGRRVSPDKTDENSVLMWKKGDIIGNEFTHFSIKKRIFRLTFRQIASLGKYIKKIMRDYLQENNILGEYTIMLDRISADKEKKTKKINIAKYNNFLIKLENDIEHFSVALKMDGISIFSTGIIEKIRDLIIKDGTIKIENKKYKYTWDFYSFNAIDSALDFLSKKISILFQETYLHYA